MHELSIAESVLAGVRRELAARSARRASKIALRIGPLAGVDGTSLDFCFTVLTRGTEFEGLELVIEPGGGDELNFAWLELEEGTP